MLEQFRANALGPLRVTEALVDNLKEGSKVAIVSSRVGSIADNGSGGNYGYREAFLTAMATALGWPTSITSCLPGTVSATRGPRAFWSRRLSHHGAQRMIMTAHPARRAMRDAVEPRK
jgi:NAD(P)-dependent dehydrogenase (short-subunit alcohol dehydrogenase family)